MESLIRKTEIEKIVGRYERRKLNGIPKLYPLQSSYPFFSLKEKIRVFWHLLVNKSVGFDKQKILEIGCGNGINNIVLILLGANPCNIVGNELLEERINFTRSLLFNSVGLIKGDASAMDFAPSSFDVINQSSVFSSILDDSVKENLSKKMWEWISPGCTILWYDFIYSNPKNNDVRGINRKKIIKLFPNCDIQFYRATFAPPIGRVIAKIKVPVCFQSTLYNLSYSLPSLRTHVYASIKKKR